MRRIITYTLFLLLVGLMVSSQNVQAIVPVDEGDAVTIIETIPYEKPYADLPEISLFRSIMHLNVPPISTPRVVEVTTATPLDPSKVVILNNVSNEPQPFSTGYTNVERTPYVVKDWAGVVDSKLSDLKSSTYSSYDLVDNTTAEMFLTMEYEQLFLADHINITFPQNVSDPLSIGIEIKTSGGWLAVVRPGTPYQANMSFPASRSKEWRITLTYDQPLRISEIALASSTEVVKNYYLRFLARPNESYLLYYDPAGTHTFNTPIYDNFENETNPLRIQGVLAPNPNYQEPDTDGDTILNNIDNCPKTSNADQLDQNNNNTGDACEDFDKDGIINAKDNCPDVPNRDQRDIDVDNVGDTCDTEESRITEKYPWLPWVGIGYIFVMTALLFFVTSRQKTTSIDSQ